MPRALGCELTKKGFVDPRSIDLDVGLKENRNPVIRRAVQNQYRRIDEPGLPLREAQARNLGVIGERGDERGSRVAWMVLEPGQSVAHQYFAARINAQRALPG